MEFVTAAPPPVYVDTPEAVEESVRRCMDATLLGADTETLQILSTTIYTNMTDQALYTGLSPDEYTRYLVPYRYLRHFAPVLENEHSVKAMHNMKYDFHRFANAGIAVGGHTFDTLMGDFLYDEDTRENRHSLDQCSWDYFGIPMGKYKELFGKADPREVQPGHALWAKFLDYASLDPWVTRKLAEHHMEKLGQVRLWPDLDTTLLSHYWDTEEPQLLCLFDMERRGIRVDRDGLEHMGVSLQREMDDVAFELNCMVGKPFNPNSTKQVRELLFRDLGLTPRSKTPGGDPSCDEKTLKYFVGQGVKECELILQYRKASKLKGTYAEGLAKWIQADGRIHTTYSATKLTGRLGSSDPNLQNVPRPDNDPHGIRSVFVPDDPSQLLIVADYAQLEMRILACFANDPTMIRAINEGLDMHSFTAAMMMGIEYDEFVALKAIGDAIALQMRQGAKNVGFGIVYGITSVGLAVQLTQKLGRVVSREEAQGYIDQYLAIYPGVQTYMDSMIEHARKKGYVQTICGRLRRLSKAKAKNWRLRGHAENQAINAPIQGSAADIVKKAMIRLNNDAYLVHELGTTLRLQVHDELVFCGPRETHAEAMEYVQYVMERPFDQPLPVPLPAEPAAVENWGAAKG